ncbi:MAG: aromatic ring-hydroxylating dioxygenase subunit alpha [Pseudomonadota bacterium]
MLDAQAEHTLRAAPQRAYTDPETVALEQERIFDQDWVMVTRVGDIPNPGDYMTAKVGNRPIALVRQDDGSIKAFANFCLHRYATLFEGKGNSRRVVCPYHAWTYNRDGQLIGVTDRDGFCKVNTRELSLEELACETALGFIFVSRRKDLPPPSERLAKLGDYIQNHDIEGYEDRIIVHEEEWIGNWKFVFENFIESYHVTYAHKESIGPSNPTNHAERGPEGHEHFSFHHNSYTEDYFPEVHNLKLNDDENRRLHVIGMYPNGLAAIDGNFMWWIALEPRGVDRTNARWGLSFSKAAMEGMEDPDGFVEAVRQIILTATAEDKAMVKRVQEGAAYASPEPGYLHDWLEVYVDEFKQYVERMLR